MTWRPKLIGFPANTFPSCAFARTCRPYSRQPGLFVGHDRVHLYYDMGIWERNGTWIYRRRGGAAAVLSGVTEPSSSSGLLWLGAGALALAVFLKKRR